jgi:hypothetical protein
MPLTPKQIAEAIERLDAVCREAQELQERLRRAMVTRARDQQQVIVNVGRDRPVRPRNRRSAERRKRKRI